MARAHILPAISNPSACDLHSRVLYVPVGRRWRSSGADWSNRSCDHDYVVCHSHRYLVRANRALRNPAFPSIQRKPHPTLDGEPKGGSAAIISSRSGRPVALSANDAATSPLAARTCDRHTRSAAPAACTLGTSGSSAQLAASAMLSNPTTLATAFIQSDNGQERPASLVAQYW